MRKFLLILAISNLGACASGSHQELMSDPQNRSDEVNQQAIYDCYVHSQKPEYHLVARKAYLHCMMEKGYRHHGYGWVEDKEGYPGLRVFTDRDLK